MSAGVALPWSRLLACEKPPAAAGSLAVMWVTASVGGSVKNVKDGRGGGMPLLLFPPFLVFLAILVLLSIAGVLESRERRRRSAAARRLFPVLSLTDPLDPCYVIVWQTQLAVLEQMSAAGSMGLAVKSLRPLFSQLARRYPELYEGTTFEEWVGFLEQERLARRTCNTMWLTTEGHAMLEHQTTPPSL